MLALGKGNKATAASKHDGVHALLLTLGGCRHGGGAHLKPGTHEGGFQALVALCHADGEQAAAFERVEVGLRLTEFQLAAGVHMAQQDGVQ